MSKWKLFIKRYNLFANDYITEERIVETNDLYHEIGKIYCTSLEQIKDIRYYEIDEKKELQKRIDKTIDYIENDLSHFTSNGIATRKYLVDILKGEDDVQDNSKDRK